MELLNQEECNFHPMVDQILEVDEEEDNKPSIDPENAVDLNTRSAIESQSVNISTINKDKFEDKLEQYLDMDINDNARSDEMSMR